MSNVATGAVECVAYRARIQHDHHDNLMLIDRVLHQAFYDLAQVHSRVSLAIGLVFPESIHPSIRAWALGKATP